MSGQYAQIGLVLATHPKARRAGRAAMGFWLEGLLHSQIQEADGFVDESFLEGGWGTKREALRLAETLCEVGLWSKVPYGYKIEKFEKWNRLRDEIAELRKRDRERKANRNATGFEPKRDRVATEPEPKRNQSEAEREQIGSAAANDSKGLADNSARNPVSDTDTTATTTPDTNKEDGFASSVSQVFEAWATGWTAAKGTTPKLTPKRRKAVVARLREGRTVADLCKAAAGIWKSEFNVQGQHIDLELACRSDGHVERFIGFHDGTIKAAPVVTGRPTVKQAFVQQTDEELQRQRKFREAGGFE